MMTLTFANITGAIGAALLMIAYLLLQLGRLEGRSLSYSVINAIGSSLIIVSLYYNFNLAAFIIELFWVLISLMGIYRATLPQAGEK